MLYSRSSQRCLAIHSTAGIYKTLQNCSQCWKHSKGQNRQKLISPRDLHTRVMSPQTDKQTKCIGPTGSFGAIGEMGNVNQGRRRTRDVGELPARAGDELQFLKGW